MIDLNSPNFNERKSPPDMVVLHYTGMRTAAEALARMCDPEAKVSAHYMVDIDGAVTRLVAEERRAWHAGVSFWKGETDINGASIGIEIVNPGHEFGYTDFPPAQIDAVIGLLDGIRERWDIPDHRILGHSDIAPARKQDPGELFPWQHLAAQGIGLWPQPDHPRRSIDIASALADIGYDTTPNTPPGPEIIAAFQRHWCQHIVSGLLTPDTESRILALHDLILRT